MIELIKPIPPNPELLQEYLNQILTSGFYTNNGPLVQQLEAELQSILGVDHILLTSNGTVSLEILLRHYAKRNSNVITTPYSYVATANAAEWLGMEVRFADLSPDSFFPDPDQIELLINEDTVAILLTQVYGLPGPLDTYVQIAQKHQLPLILDAAHAFGVRYKGKPIAAYGTASSFSFHATKIFNTVEGGAIALNDAELKEECFNYRSFGHRGEEYHSRGINAKNSEVHAAFGLSQIPTLAENLLKRKSVFEQYVEQFRNAPFKVVTIDADLDWNYCYFPLILENEQIREELREYLLAKGIMARRYFYPSLDTLPQFVGQQSVCTNSSAIAKRVLCIPHHANLSPDDQHRVIEVLKRYFGMP